MRIALPVIALVLMTAAVSAQPPQGTVVHHPGIGPKTLGPVDVACTDLPASASPNPGLRILAPIRDDSHELSYRDDLVILGGETTGAVAPGQRFFTRRFLEPRSGEAASAKDRGSIRTSGWLTVVSVDQHSMIARIDYACDAVAAGDYLDPYVEPALPTAMTGAGPTDVAQLGRVLSGVDRRESFGAGDLLSIDRGAAHGVTTGARVVFYRDRLDGTPLVELGAGVVVEVSSDSSKVVLERARFAIATGDLFGLRQP